MADPTELKTLELHQSVIWDLCRMVVNLQIENLALQAHLTNQCLHPERLEAIRASIRTEMKGTLDSLDESKPDHWLEIMLRAFA